MNWKKLLSIGALTMFSASIATGQGTAPTIVQGDYISNVFGNSNFIKNPNAKLNNKDVTVSNATVTRSTTTPLVATSEFLVTVTSANGTIAWNTRTFDQGMKGQNCEARFTYRGFQSTSVAQVRQGATVAGANVVARLALTASTDPRIASINFPCGDLSQPTYFVITDTATLSGTHEIGGAYVGLATNMANVAQAEEIGTAVYQGGVSCGWSKTGATVGYESFAAAGGTCNWTNTGSITPQTKLLKFDATLKPGKYQAILNATVTRGSGVNNDTKFVLTDGTSFSGTAGPYIDNTLATQMPATFTLPFEVTTTTSKTIELKISSSTAGLAGAVIGYNNEYYVRFALYRFPSSSELVVTPERQNVWAAIRWSNSSGTQFQSVVNNTWTSGSSTLFSDSYATAFGKASLTGANSSQIRISNMPVGYYRIKYNGSNYANTGTAIAAFPECRSRIFETSTSTTVSQNAWFGMANVVSDVVSPGLEGVFYNSAVGDRTFRFDIAMAQPTTGIASQRCGFFSGLNETGATSSGAVGSPWMIVQPLDQPTNSALYVEGPVKASATGAAIPSGYAGQVIHSIQSTNQTMASANWAEITGLSITLTPGIWMVQGTGYWHRNNATMTQFEMACGLGSSSGDVSANYAATKFYRIRTAQEVALPSQVSANSLAIRSFYVRSDGTNLYFADGTTFISGSQTIKMACYTGTWTGGPVQASGVIEAVRLN